LDKDGGKNEIGQNWPSCAVAVERNNGGVRMNNGSVRIIGGVK